MPMTAAGKRSYSRVYYQRNRERILEQRKIYKARKSGRRCDTGYIESIISEAKGIITEAKGNPVKVGRLMHTLRNTRAQGSDKPEVQEKV